MKVFNPQRTTLELFDRYVKYHEGKAIDVNVMYWTALLDTKTRLMWSVHLPIEPQTMFEAKTFIDELNRVGWCGFHDWRLPYTRQLKSLLLFTPHGQHDETRYHALFPEQYREHVFWSSDVEASYAGIHPWVLDVNNHKFQIVSPWYQSFLRLVRTI